MRQPALVLLVALAFARPAAADDLADCQNDALELDKRTAACTRVTDASKARLENTQLMSKCIAEAWGLDPPNASLEATCNAALERNPAVFNYLNRATVHNRLGNSDRRDADLAVARQLRGPAAAGPPPTTASTSPVPPPAQPPAPAASQRSTRRGWIGVVLESLSANDASYLGLTSNAGARILHIMDGTPAHLSGLEVNDIILAVNDAAVTDLESCVSAISALPPGTPSILTIYRKRKRAIAVQIDARPDIDPKSVPPMPRSTSMSIHCQAEYAKWKANRRHHGAFAVASDGSCGIAYAWRDLTVARQKAMQECTVTKPPCELIDEY